MIKDITGQVNNVSSVVKIWYENFRKNWISSLLNLVLYIFPIFLSVPDINNYILNNFYLIIFIVVIIYIINERFKLKNIVSKDLKIKELENEKNKLEQTTESIGLFLESLPKEFLASVSRFLDLKNSERISLYVLTGDKFRIIGRYSENPKYDRLYRLEYPADCGYISKCLENNNGDSFYFRRGLPKNEKKYIERVSNETGMDVNAIKKLSMRSRTYFTRVIKDKMNKNVGILVIESTNPDLPVSPNEMNTKLEELSIPHMATYLDISSKLKGGESVEG
jgi:hypothetical protein